MDSIKNRYGRFRVSDVMVDTDPTSLLLLGSKVVVVKCEHEYSTRTFDYTALSPMFEEIPDCMVPPEYDIIFQRRQADLIVTAERKKEATR